ncbi:hypothetical protein OCGS_2302 [Oceaniovalibus guishaninsula JLT2003]|uniref:Uncharacterized protein n=1 Tax=Oceaniovalibus guishaninsula JLT2003 TaxID=1231392 RepID=K2I3Y9_9RHOB|nr:hypothetical protein OCGS_2302 [Oceaniovalibus guishaninsula JLT2003]
MQNTVARPPQRGMQAVDGQGPHIPGHVPQVLAVCLIIGHERNASSPIF